MAGYEIIVPFTRVEPMTISLGSVGYQVAPGAFFILDPRFRVVEDMAPETIEGILARLATGGHFKIQIGLPGIVPGFPPENSLKTVELGSTLWQVWHTFEALPMLDSYYHVRARESYALQELDKVQARWPEIPKPRWYSHRIRRKTYCWGFGEGQDPADYYQETHNAIPNR